MTKASRPRADGLGRIVERNGGTYSLYMAVFAQRWPGLEREYKFHPVRKFRFDFAWPEHDLALEIEGGVWKKGRHNRPLGFIKDMEKYNEAVILGWRILRVTPEMLKNGVAMQLLERAMGR